MRISVASYLLPVPSCPLERKLATGNW